MHDSSYGYVIGCGGVKGKNAAEVVCNDKGCLISVMLYITSVMQKFSSCHLLCTKFVHEIGYSTDLQLTHCRAIVMRKT